MHPTLFLARLLLDQGHVIDKLIRQLIKNFLRKERWVVGEFIEWHKLDQVSLCLTPFGIHHLTIIIVEHLHVQKLVLPNTHDNDG
jgi:predicted membrane chloride channel (bestrophin family)